MPSNTTNYPSGASAGRRTNSASGHHAPTDAAGAARDLPARPSAIASRFHPGPARRRAPVPPIRRTTAARRGRVTAVGRGISCRPGRPRARAARRRCRAGGSSDRARGSAAAARTIAGGVPAGSAPTVDVLPEHGGERVGDRLALEQRAAGQHLEQHDAERPDVGALVDASGRAPAPGVM